MRIKQLGGPDIYLGLAIVFIVGIILIPFPAIFLDFLIMMSFAFAFLILITSLYVREPVEFFSYPSILIIVTLYRLAVNIATTRRILAHGHEFATMEGAVSRIIEFFGNVVMAGNFAIGLVIFIVITLINFIVITRGASRIAEVAARFTLDALPGKQLSIDADLNAGIITVEEARKRRERLTREADFYGAMDGASKFVRGEAVAGIIITLVNIIGGIFIGVVQKGMDFMSSLNIYTRLTVGDGLSAQIPALIISTSAGMIVARSSLGGEFAEDVIKQFTAYPRAILTLSVVMAILGFIFGGVAIPLFLILAGILFYYAWKSMKREEEERAKEMEKPASPPPIPREEEEQKQLYEVLQPDVLGLEVGYALIPYVDESRGGEIIRRIKAMRRSMAEDMGIIVPLIHIKDNLLLKPTEYSILIKGVEVLRGMVYQGKYLVISTGKIDLEGIRVQDPVFGVEVVWIDENLQDEAKAKGYTVVDIPSVIMTHLSEIIKRHAWEILTRQDTQKLLDIIKKDHPKLVEDVLNLLPLSVIHRVLQNLLKEGIPIKDMVSILESLGDWGGQIKDPDQLTEYARQSLWRTITKIYQQNGEIICVAVSPEFEQKILEGIEEKEGIVRVKLDPQIIQKISDTLSKSMEKFLNYKVQPLIVTSSSTRRYIKKFIEGYFPQVPVISFQEIDPKIKIKAVGVVR